jgi:hypothetical protein
MRILIGLALLSAACSKSSDDPKPAPPAPHGPQRTLLGIDPDKWECTAIVSDAEVEQDFQRGRAEWAPGRYPDNYDVTWALVNDELIDAREELAALRKQLAEREAA